MEPPGLARLVALLTVAGAASLAAAQSDPQQTERVKPVPEEPRIREEAKDADAARCAKLEGELREQCLRDLGAAAGASEPPKPAPPASVQRDAVTEPPPQNPRQPR